jgi:hypothetical protein
MPINGMSAVIAVFIGVAVVIPALASGGEQFDLEYEIHSLLAAVRRDKRGQSIKIKDSFF